MVIVVSTKAVLVSVTVKTAVRADPVLVATANWMVPFPEPDAPWVTVRKAALLTAPQVQLLVVLTDTDPEPPAAGKLVIVLPVMTVHPFEPPGDVGLPPQAVATSSSAAMEATRVRLKAR
jgi:hypothetical protein